MSAAHTTRSTGAAHVDASLAPFPPLIAASATGEESCLLDGNSQIFNALQDSKAVRDGTQTEDMLSEELLLRASLRHQEGFSEH